MHKMIVSAACLVLAGPALAQPIIVPLGPKPPAPQAAAPSAPPVAPPMAGPSLPTTNDLAGQSPTVAPGEESAAAPAPSR